MRQSPRRIVPAEHEERHRWLRMLVRASIAYQVQTLRIARNWSRAELARRAGISMQEVARIEKPDGPSPSLRTLLQIAQACDCGFICRFTDWDTFVDHMGGLIPPSAYDQEAMNALVSEAQSPGDAAPESEQ